MNHRFVIMTAGFASVQPAAGLAVHGVLWDLAFADVPALDRFEDVAGGLYVKTMRPVVKSVGSVRALLYLGRRPEGGSPQPGYLESVMAAAQAADLPQHYLKSLAGLFKTGARGPAFVDGAPGSPPGGGNGVPQRFATPHRP